MSVPASRSNLPTMAARAMILHCPRCGSAGIMRNYFNLKDRCPTCSLVFNRGESSDYWLGGFTINFIVAEFAAVILTVVFVLITLPDVPWNTVGFTALASATILPIAFFPFSRTLWLALDLFARPHLRGDRAYRSH